jgi:hypothetical protein
MKKISISSLFFNILIALFIGSLFLPVLGYQALFVSAIFFLIGFLLPSKKEVDRNLAFAGLLKEVWINEIKENFFAEAPHIIRSYDMSAYVDNNVINLADAAVNPNVLINNTADIAITDYNPAALTIPLEYFDTVNTRIRNVLKKQYQFDGIKSMSKQHKNTLAEKIAKKVTFNWTPNSNSAFTPVLVASGAARADNGLKALSIRDIARMQTAFDELNAPQMGRVLILSPKHREDLLNENANLFNQFAELKAGKILSLYGFDIYVYSLNPIYNRTTGVKTAFEAAAAATDTYCSLFYQENEVMRAEGTLDIFFTPKEINNVSRADVFGLQQFYTGRPVRNKLVGAVYSN